jgi:hypothetical protein
MNPLFAALCFGVVVAQFLVPRRYAFVPLLIAVLHLPNVPVMQIGVTFTITKLVLLAGLSRALYERRLEWSPRQPLDAVVLLWASFALLSAFFHHPPEGNPFTIRLSLVYDIFGAYLYARAFIKDLDDFLRLSNCLAAVLLPLAALMVVESITGRNLYSAFGAPLPDFRSGRFRANGPFGHAILAGTVGGGSFLVALAGRHRNYWLGTAGVVACTAIVISSNSSGPLVTLMVALMGLAFWRWRTYLGEIRLIALACLAGLHLIMTAPVWYLMTRVDLTGGSTGYHRAELITQAINHIGEWWLVGTDYTRHWMPYGVLWSKDHIDITNYYIAMGVTGGLPLMLSFIAIFVKAFQLLGRKMRVLRGTRRRSEFVLWCSGSALAAYAFTSISVSYFDQTFIMFCILFGTVPALAKKTVMKPVAVTSHPQPQLAPLQLPDVI